MIDRAKELENMLIDIVIILDDYEEKGLTRKEIFDYIYQNNRWG